MFKMISDVIGHLHDKSPGFLNSYIYQGQQDMGTAYFSLFDMSNQMREISKTLLAFSTFVKGYCQSFLTPSYGFLMHVLLYTCTGP